MKRDPLKPALAIGALLVLAGLIFYNRTRPAPMAAKEQPLAFDEIVNERQVTNPSVPKKEQVTPLAKLRLPKGAIQNELLFQFPNASSMQAFVERATRAGGRVLGMIPKLNLLRIGFDSEELGERLRALAPENALAGFNYIVAPPRPRDPAKEDSGGPYRGFGDQALSWLGVPADHSGWGRGVKVAVLDTGMTDVPGLSQRAFGKLDLVGGMTGESLVEQHGTAVASIIAGDAENAPGVAPSAELLGVRVLDENGVGNSFTVAQGIIEAVDQGARVVSLSLGSEGDSFVLKSAVDYALAHDVALVAAVGNEGFDAVSYPAKYPGVIGVTAVDANGQRAQFANYGAEVAIAAPGIGIFTPWSADKVLDMSGTSAAVPFVSGALAAILSENPGMTASAATSLLLKYANDAGAAGPDPMYGAGILSIDRVLNRNQPNIHDGAAADVFYNPQNTDSPLAVTVQNRGTTTLLNVKVEVSVAEQPMNFNISTLRVGEVRSLAIPLTPAQNQNPEGLAVASRVVLDAVSDAKPGNDSKVVVLKKSTGK